MSDHEEDHVQHADKLGFPLEKEIKQLQEIMQLVQDLKSDPNVPLLLQTFVDVLAQVELLRLALKSATPGASVDAVLAALPKFQEDAEKLSKEVKALYADLKAKHPNIVKLPPPAVELPAGE